MAPLKSGWTGAVSASAREQNNVDMAQQREPLLTGEFERANDLTAAGIELPRDTPDDQDELKKLKGSKSRDMVDDFESGCTGAVSASAQEQNNVDMAQQQEPLLTGECEQAIDLNGGIELQHDAPDDQDELKKLKGSKYRDMPCLLLLLNSFTWKEWHEGKAGAYCPFLIAHRLGSLVALLLSILDWLVLSGNVFIRQWSTPDDTFFPSLKEFCFMTLWTFVIWVGLILAGGECFWKLRPCD
ncbi:hypothetical protein DKX38_028783 [Salix brachista]|uniref:Uncharacterized protein n=1 Tax=Salix brachista TaxID=2182728 RepID=A0A5N5J2D9_9ROSI|nr:hypothetical protein DKX38_028783 [Salix brachista]